MEVELRELRREKAEDSLYMGELVGRLEKQAQMLEMSETRQEEATGEIMRLTMQLQQAMSEGRLKDQKAA